MCWSLIYPYSSDSLYRKWAQSNKIHLGEPCTVQVMIFQKQIDTWIQNCYRPNPIYSENVINVKYSRLAATSSNMPTLGHSRVGHHLRCKVKRGRRGQDRKCKQWFVSKGIKSLPFGKRDIPVSPGIDSTRKQAKNTQWQQTQISRLKQHDAWDVNLSKAINEHW